MCRVETVKDHCAVRLGGLVATAALIALAGVCILSAACAAQAFAYDSRGKHDPFLPWVTGDGRLQILQSQEEKKDVSLAVEGIIFDKYGISYAIVNGQVVKIGDIIDDYQVLKIEERKMVFIREGQLKEVVLEEEAR